MNQVLSPGFISLPETTTTLHPVLEQALSQAMSLIKQSFCNVLQEKEHEMERLQKLVEQKDVDIQELNRWVATLENKLLHAKEEVKWLTLQQQKWTDLRNVVWEKLEGVDFDRERWEKWRGEELEDIEHRPSGQVQDPMNSKSYRAAKDKGCRGQAETIYGTKSKSDQSQPHSSKDSRKQPIHPQKARPATESHPREETSMPSYACTSTHHPRTSNEKDINEASKKGMNSRSILKVARDVLSFSEFSMLLSIIKQYNSRELSRQQTIVSIQELLHHRYPEICKQLMELL